MRIEELKVGAVYMLRGGHIMRYQGLYAGKGPCLAFRVPSDEVSEPAVGYSASVDDVLYEMSDVHIPVLETRVRDSLARNLYKEAFEAKLVIAELTSPPPPPV